MTLPLRIDLADLEALDRATVREVAPAVKILLAPLAFGVRCFDQNRVIERPYPGAWREDAYTAPAIRVARVRDAVVQSCCGVMLVGLPNPEGPGDCLHMVNETLHNVVFEEHLLVVDPETGKLIELQSAGINRVAGRAVHLLGGGETNYYHWQVDVLAKLPQLLPDHRDDLFLLPPITLPFQQETLALAAGARPLRFHEIDRGRTVVVDDLVFVPNLNDFGWNLRHENLDLYPGLRPRGPGERKLYLARGPSAKRPLVNEPEIIARLAAAGFDIIPLEGVSVHEQARLMAEARVIVAPHGAGLTNLVFCGPGTTVCELHMDSYLNWVFRRMANLLGLRYGCVVGETLGAWDPLAPHDKPWRLPLEDLEAALSEAGALSPPSWTVA
ncbi:glycosyltransferase family 61 protein [Pararhodospirillum photometricum]|uniref:Capsular polysaccharide biosynthesis protein-like protein n=1 Tax=Pararhodospirillum photometricum DSM 122 TaxID=1150469 RepID=H6SS86_PARPM|nr:glycosyltransferase family 61 protein [Pararhodospirillum photometricum]CCG07765.1 Capsular polysaccharide biosynthesis protein-like protein [Pararhodospirillum photometricum DSM 122]